MFQAELFSSPSPLFYNLSPGPYSGAPYHPYQRGAQPQHTVERSAFWGKFSNDGTHPLLALPAINVCNLQSSTTIWNLIDNVFHCISCVKPLINKNKPGLSYGKLSDVVPVAKLEDFTALNSSNLKQFRPLKFYNLEDFTTLKRKFQRFTLFLKCSNSLNV